MLVTAGLFSQKKRSRRSAGTCTFPGRWFRKSFRRTPRSFIASAHGSPFAGLPLPGAENDRQTSRERLTAIRISRICALLDTQAACGGQALCDRLAMANRHRVRRCRAVCQRRSAPALSKTICARQTCFCGLALGKWRALQKERGAFHGQAAATVREGICDRSRSAG